MGLEGRRYGEWPVSGSKELLARFGTWVWDGLSRP